MDHFRPRKGRQTCGGLGCYTNEFPACSGDRARWMFTPPLESGGLVTLPNAQFTDLWWNFLPAF